MDRRELGVTCGFKHSTEIYEAAVKKAVLLLSPHFPNSDLFSLPFHSLVPFFTFVGIILTGARLVSGLPFGCSASQWWHHLCLKAVIVLNAFIYFEEKLFNAAYRSLEASGVACL